MADKGVEGRRPCPHWHVWRAADALDPSAPPIANLGEADQAGTPTTLPSSSLLSDSKSRRRYGRLAVDAAGVLRSWGWRFGGAADGAGETSSSSWVGLLNKSSLLHEVEESLVAIEALAGWLSANDGVRDKGGSGGVGDGAVALDAGGEREAADGAAAAPLVCAPCGGSQDTSSRGDAGDDVTVVDLCCGKGVLSMMLSYLAARESDICAPLRRVRRIVMVDRASIGWGHISQLNADVNANKYAAVPVETWGGTNVHDPAFFARLLSLPSPLAVVGIHLCRNLSPRALSLFNRLGRERAPFLCLAPCCMPLALNARKTRKKGKSQRKDGGAPISGSGKGRGDVEETAADGEAAADAAGEGKEECKGKGKAAVLRVDLYETDERREEREEHELRKRRARGKTAGGAGGRNKCYVCGEGRHRVRDCPALPPKGADEARRTAMVEAAKERLRGERGGGEDVMGACWRCGGFGHRFSDCPPSAQKETVGGGDTSDASRTMAATAKPARLPGLDLDASSVRSCSDPFGAYCRLLAGAAQLSGSGSGGEVGKPGGGDDKGTMEVRETSLVSSTGGHSLGNKGAEKRDALSTREESRRQSYARRKSTYIVVCR